MLVSHGIFSMAELHSRYEITLENYCKTVNIEGQTMVEMARREILPAIEAYAHELACTAAAKQLCRETADTTEAAVAVRDTVLPAMAELRLPCDEAETITAERYWPFPTYEKLLFGVN